MQPHVKPEDQGLATALLDGAMRQGNLDELMTLVNLLLEQSVPNIHALYGLCQKDHPEMPTWDDLLDRMDEQM